MGLFQIAGASEWRSGTMMTSSNGIVFRVTGHLCGEFPAQRPVTRSFDVFFDLRLNKRLSKQSWGWWFETPSRPLWCHRNALLPYRLLTGNGFICGTRSGQSVHTTNIVCESLCYSFIYHIHHICYFGLLRCIIFYIVALVHNRKNANVVKWHSHTVFMYLCEKKTFAFDLVCPNNQLSKEYVDWSDALGVTFTTTMLLIIKICKATNETGIFE